MMAAHPFVGRPVLRAPKGEEYHGVRCEVCDQPRDPVHTNQPVLDRALLAMQHPHGQLTVTVLSDGKRRKAFEKMGWRVVGFSGFAPTDRDLLNEWDRWVRAWRLYRRMGLDLTVHGEVLCAMGLTPPHEVAYGGCL